MRVKLEDLSPEKRAAVQDFKSDITSVFNDLYEDKWDQERWDRAVGKQISVHSLPRWKATCRKHVHRNRASPATASRLSRLAFLRFVSNLSILVADPPTPRLAVVLML